MDIAQDGEHGASDWVRGFKLCYNAGAPPRCWCEYGTHKTVKARLCPWLFREMSLKPLKFFNNDAAASSSALFSTWWPGLEGATLWEILPHPMYTLSHPSEVTKLLAASTRARVALPALQGSFPVVFEAHRLLYHSA